MRQLFHHSKTYPVYFLCEDRLHPSSGQSLTILKAKKQQDHARRGTASFQVYKIIVNGCTLFYLHYPSQNNKNNYTIVGHIREIWIFLSDVV
jgi:hypothetical protein